VYRKTLVAHRRREELWGHCPDRDRIRGLSDLSGCGAPRNHCVAGGLLPFMTYFVVTMAVAFFLFSGFHVYEVTRSSRKTSDRASGRPCRRRSAARLPRR